MAGADACNSSGRAAISSGGNPLCGSIFKKLPKNVCTEMCDTMTTCKGMSSCNHFPSVSLDSPESFGSIDR